MAKWRTRCKPCHAPADGVLTEPFVEEFAGSRQREARVTWTYPSIDYNNDVKSNPTIGGGVESMSRVGMGASGGFQLTVSESMVLDEDAWRDDEPTVFAGWQADVARATEIGDEQHASIHRPHRRRVQVRRAGNSHRRSAIRFQEPQSRPLPSSGSLAPASRQRSSVGDRHP